MSRRAVPSDPRPASPTIAPTAARSSSPWWAASGALALLAGAAWLREPALPYLLTCAAATVAAVAQTFGRRPVAARLASVALVGFCVVTAIGQQQLARIDRAWPVAENDLTRHSAAVMQRELATVAAQLQRTATRALDAPVEPSRAFAWLTSLAHGAGERGVVAYRAGTPVAWAGWVGAPIDSGLAPFVIVRSDFYVTLQAVAVRGSDRAVATALLHAEPPADRLSSPLDELVAAETDVDSFTFDAPPSMGQPGAFATGAAATLTMGSVPLITLRPVPPRSDEARVRAIERATSRGALVFALAIIAFVAAEWRPRTAAWWRRIVALVVPLAAVAFVPLSAYSNASRLFDPTYFFSPVGGPYTASVGALGVAGALVLLVGLAAARARLRLRPPWLAAIVAVTVSIGALLALRHVAAGITPPGAAVPLTLWVGWQVALALSTTALLVGATVAARGALPRGRGLPASVGIGLAALAAALGPALWTVPNGWPFWYFGLWCAAAVAASFARRARWGVIPAAIVAALASSVTVWGTTAEKRLVLAERDLARLAVPDPEAVTLLQRLGIDIAVGGPPSTRGDLLRRFARSDLAAAAYPVQLAIWSPNGERQATLALARFDTDSAAVARIAHLAQQRHTMLLTSIAGFPGVQLVLAVPALGGQVTTAVVAPQTQPVVASQAQLSMDNAFSMLVGLAPDATGTPPYTISFPELVPRRLKGGPAAADSAGLDESIPGETGSVAPSQAVDSALSSIQSPTALQSTPEQPLAAAQAGLAPVQWRRTGSDLHGDWLVPSTLGPARAHVEIALRPFDALAQRAVLLVVVDLIAVTLLWALSAVGDGVLARWTRARLRRGARSYRIQLTVVLFTFFVVPAALFALWSYRRLRSDDSEERALLVWQTLRAAATGGLDEMPADADRVGTPLLLYENGRLHSVSDTLFDELAPLGRFLRADVELELGLGTEVRTSHVQVLGAMPVLFGYRAVDAPSGQRVVLAAPARSDEIGLESRRTDLGILVLFSTVLGAVAALWLSGLAARQLARPIESLRRAAVAVAAGEREPDLAGDPPAEFAPVFAAFRRMAADFGESQRVLAWGEMARQVAHEIKNPLTPIRLGIQHLQRARAAGRPDFDRILDQNAGRILAEIDRLDNIARVFSRYGSGPAERAPAEPTDLSPVLRDVVGLERLGAGGGVKWELTGADQSVVALARGDEVREVLLNVLENARLAQARRVSVAMSVDRGMSERRTGDRSTPPRDAISRDAVSRDAVSRVVIAIDDDGTGIPAEVLPRIFEPHFSTRTSGSGLGLAVSRRVVEGWGGSINVQSQPGQGTRVTIALLLMST